MVGRLKTETWTDREGQTRKNFKIVADQVNRVRPFMVSAHSSHLGDFLLSTVTCGPSQYLCSFLRDMCSDGAP